MSTHKRSRGCLGLMLSPFIFVGKSILAIIRLVGRFIGLFIGFVLMVAGVILCATIVGAVIGVPLITLGLLLMVRSLF